MSATSIEWTDRTWNPVRGCSRVSEGCRNCYAERVAARFSGEGQPFYGIAHRAVNGVVGAGWTGRVELVESKLEEPLHWRTPQRVFVNSMSDLFHEALQDVAIDRVFAVMALAPEHTFQVLTKRPKRMLDWIMSRGASGVKHSIGLEMARHLPKAVVATGVAYIEWPLPNVWLGVSVEDQKTADERIPLLLETPAALHFVSYEPALGPVAFQPWLHGAVLPGVNWIIVGGESGPGARPFCLATAYNVVAQCRAARVPVFVKQLGAWPVDCAEDLSPDEEESRRLILRSRKGGDMEEWPEGLRVREFPAVSVPQ